MWVVQLTAWVSHRRREGQQSRLRLQTDHMASVTVTAMIGAGACAMPAHANVVTRSTTNSRRGVVKKKKTVAFGSRQNIGLLGRGRGKDNVFDPQA